MAAGGLGPLQVWAGISLLNVVRLTSTLVEHRFVILYLERVRSIDDMSWAASLSVMFYILRTNSLWHRRLANLQLLFRSRSDSIYLSHASADRVRQAFFVQPASISCLLFLFAGPELPRPPHADLFAFGPVRSGQLLDQVQVDFLQFCDVWCCL